MRLVSLLQASEDLLMQHYIDLKDRPFFPTLINYMSSGPVVAMVRDNTADCRRHVCDMSEPEREPKTCSAAWLLWKMNTHNLPGV